MIFSGIDITIYCELDEMKFLSWANSFFKLKEGEIWNWSWEIENNDRVIINLNFSSEEDETIISLIPNCDLEVENCVELAIGESLLNDFNSDVLINHPQDDEKFILMTVEGNIYLTEEGVNEDETSYRCNPVKTSMEALRDQCVNQ